MDQPEKKLTRREKERLTRRREIIDAARQVFAYKGFTNATLDEIALLAEYGKTSLYNYFKTKEELFEHVIADSFEEIKAIAARAFETEEAFKVQIEQFAEWELRYFYDNIESFYLMRNESHHLRDTNPIFRLLPELLRTIANAIEAEQKRKTIKEGDSLLYALMFLNLISTRAAAHIYVELLGNGPEAMMKGITLQNFGERLKEMKPLEPEQIKMEAAFVADMFLHGAMK